MIEVPLGRVCIVMMSAVGDAVHVLPVINALRRHAPGVHITWVLQPGPATLVAGHPGVDDVILFDRRRGVRGFRDIRRALAGREFDLVLALQVYFKAGLVTSFTRAPVKLGFDRARARDGNWLLTTHRIPARPIQHVQDQYFEFLHALGVDPEPLTWGLGPWGTERQWQSAFLARFHRPIASIVVGTSNPAKDWPAERWARVADVLWAEYGLQPVLVGGESERERRAAETIMSRASHPVVSALGSGLRNLVSILDGSAIALAPDTGPLHMAVALDTPVVSLIGLHDPRRTGPYRRFHDLMIDAYNDPGSTHGVTMEKRPGRMSHITVDQVLERVERWNQSYRPTRSGPKG